MESLNVYASPLPFSNKQVKQYASPGSSVFDIVNNVCPERLVGAVDAIVMIDGHIIYRQYWHLVRPKMGTIVNVRVVPTGGKGKKNPIASLLSIAVMIAAPYIGAAIAGFAGVTSAIGTALITTGVSVLGRMAVSALAPPPKPSNAGGPISNPSESPTQFIEGARNSISPYGVIPICLGTNRMFPLLAARTFTETFNNDQYVRQLFTYGYGANIAISNLRVGETPIENFNNFELEHKLEGDLHEGTELYTNDVFQADMSVLLQEVDGFTERNIQLDSDEVIVDVTFPRGLAQFNNQGTRISRNVQLELQWAEVGSSDWSGGSITYKPYPGAVFNVAELGQNITARTDYVVVDIATGVVSYLQGNPSSFYFQGSPPIVSGNNIRVAQVNLTKASNTAPTVMTVEDIRGSSIGYYFEDSDSFIPSQTDDFQITITDGAVRFNNLDITGSTTEALRRSARIVFPERGDYKIRIRRVSADTSSDQIFDNVYLTAIKSITYQLPVRLVGLNGTAIRMKATDQINGQLDQFNVIATNIIDEYFPGTDTWEPAPTSNPAALYRYVLQGPANSKPLSDAEIDLEAIESWHVYCAEKGFTYDRVIDYDTSVDDILRDIASAGAASPAVVDGKRSIVVDRDKPDIVQMITPRNSWGYSGEMQYIELPHAFRVQFRNRERGYEQDERIVYADGYDINNATLFETLEAQFCDNAQFAWKIGRRFLATAKLRPETHTFMLDIENLVAMRGDRIKLQNDVPLVGVGNGRIKTVLDDGVNVTGIIIDDTVGIPGAGTYYARIRLSDGTQLYKQINASMGNFSEFTFTTPFPISDTPESGDLVAFSQAGGELDLIITRIEPMSDLTAKITCLNYAPEIFTSDTGVIPPFNSNITTPLEFIRPIAPVLVEYQSDESVMIRNSDGTFITRAVITLQNLNQSDVSVDVKIRRSGDTAFINANLLQRDPDRVVITGLQDNARYDIHIRYRRNGTTVMSLPLQLNNFLYIGASGPPADVTGFLITVTGESAILKWDANDDIDISHYVIKFSGQYTGASWDTAQILEASVFENRITIPFQGGTYLIKAVDLAGNESINATAIITYNPGSIANAVEIIEEDPEFLGVKDNVIKTGSALTLDDIDNPLGYYYFNQDIDLTGIFTSFVSASIIANGSFYNDIFAMDDIFAVDDLFGGGNNDIFAMDDIFAVEDIFGIGLGAWRVTLEYRMTNQDPIDDVWTDWEVFDAGNYEFRAIQFRLKMESLAPGVTPLVSQLAVTVDMPDRIERGEDLTVPVEGAVITYEPAFKSDPAVVITTQDGDAADEIEFIYKNPSGFSFKVYNRVSEEYVERTYDFISSGWGRLSE